MGLVRLRNSIFNSISVTICGQWLLYWTAQSSIFHKKGPDTHDCFYLINPTAQKGGKEGININRRACLRDTVYTRHCCTGHGRSRSRTGAPHAPASGPPHTALLGSTSRSDSPLLGGSALGTHCATGVLCAPRTAPPDGLLPVLLYGESSQRDSAAPGTRGQIHVH